MKKSFEDYLSFIENDLGCKLLDYQKILLRQVCEGKHYYYCCNRWSATHWIYDSMHKLKEETDRGDGSYFPWLYKPDGHTTDIVIYDELEKENAI